MTMNISHRIAESTKQFDNLKQQREKILAEADSLLAEMNKLSGEYRLLQEMQQEENTVADVPTDTANVIEVTPEEDK